LFCDEASLRVAATLAFSNVAGFNVRTGTKRNRRMDGQIERAVWREASLTVVLYHRNHYQMCLGCHVPPDSRTPRFIYPAVYETSEDIIARGPTSFFDTCASAVSDILNISLCSPLFVVEFDLQCVGYTTELTVHPCSCQMCRGGELMVKLDEQVN
jgi:hypothetical protein